MLILQTCESIKATTEQECTKVIKANFRNGNKKYYDVIQKRSKQCSLNLADVRKKEKEASLNMTSNKCFKEKKQNHCCDGGDWWSLEMKCQQIQ